MKGKTSYGTAGNKNNNKLPITSTLRVSFWNKATIDTDNNAIDEAKPEPVKISKEFRSSRFSFCKNCVIV